MRLEFLSSGALECPLLRLFDFNLEEARQLFGVFEGLGSTGCRHIDLNGLPYIQGVNGCRLVLIHGEADLGIEETAEGFICRLSGRAWREIAELTLPFCEPQARGYQWLTRSGDISLLLSVNGQW